MSRNQNPANLVVHVQVRAGRTEVVGPHGDGIKIRIAAPPVDGAANAELIRLVANRLRVTREAVTIVAGTTSRRKVIRVAGTSADRVRRVLLALP